MRAGDIIKSLRLDRVHNHIGGVSLEREGGPTRNRKTGPSGDVRVDGLKSASASKLYLALHEGPWKKP